MGESKIQAVPAPPARNLFSVLAAEPQIVTPETAAAAKPKTEPTMLGLRRILGDSVLNIFPKALRDAVDASYKFWEMTPDSYIGTTYDSAEDLADSLFVMRAYAEAADNGGYTIRTTASGDPCVLQWRAQTRRGSKTAE